MNVRVVKIPAMTIEPPIIQMIHGTDAPQHAAELKSILLRMKSEKRISALQVLDFTMTPGNLSFKIEDRQGIIVLLTNEIENQRSEVEKNIKNFSVGKRDLKLIEIIVDNLPYHNNFISFPQDLMPIRSRDDMNHVWNEIENDLKAIFPKPAEPEPIAEPVRKSNSKIILRVIAIAVMTAVLAGIIAVSLIDNDQISDEAQSFFTPVIFSFLIPIIIFFRHRKDLEGSALTRRQDGSEEVVSWKTLLITTAIGFLLLFLAIGIFSSEFPDVATILGVAVVLPLLLYRRKSKHDNNSEDNGSKTPQSKNYLKSLGRYLLFLFLGMVYWWAVLIVFQRENTLHLLFIMPVITTIGIFLIRFRQKQTWPSP